MEPEFGVKTAKLGQGAYVVSVTGEADVHTAPAIERELEDVLRRGGRAVALDLVEVGFIDSTALGLMLTVLRTLEITGLDRLFRIERRLSNAVQGLHDGALSDESAARAL